MSSLVYVSINAANALIMQYSDLVFFSWTQKTKNCGLTIVTHLQKGTRSMLLSSLHKNTVNTISVEGCDYAALALPKMWD